MKMPNIVTIIILAGCLLLQFTTLCFHTRGAAGDLDLAFDPGSGVNGPVNAVAVQPDGKMIIGGQFTAVKGLARTNLARLNPDGSGDAMFNPGVAHNLVSALALQSDGRVLVGGQSTVMICDEFECYEFDGLRVSRLNADGSPDVSFNPATGVNGSISTVAVQSDGKVLIGGFFTVVNGADRNHIVRLNSNGSLDDSFYTGTGASDTVSSIALQPDGKVVIGGSFGAVNGTNRNSIARLNADGSLDGSFNAGVGYPYSVSCVVVQPDEKVLIGGGFSTVNGTNRNGIARLNANGSLDGSFNPGAGVGDYPNRVRSVVLLSNGKVLIGGSFATVNGTNRNHIARLNANGSLDGSFDPGTGPNYHVAAVVSQSGGKVFIIGDFSKVNGTNSTRVARLDPNGSLDRSFDPGTGVTSSTTSLVVQPDGKVLIGGVFTFINGTNRYGRARLNPDGSVDESFIADIFNPDLAAVFNVDCPPGVRCEDWVSANSLAVQPDGKVLVGGSNYHREFDWEGWLNTDYIIYRLVRFNATGSLDRSFDFTNTESLGRVGSIALQSDGKIIIGSESFPSNIARLNADGSRDSSFNPGTGPNAGVTSVAWQPDGRVLIGGSFTAVNGTNRNRIARLNPNGSLDSSFNPGTGANGVVSSIVVPSDGKVLIGGAFTIVDGTARNRMARLNADGSMDFSFDPGSGANGVVRTLALQPDGNVLIGGDFLTVNGVVRPYVARLFGESAVPFLNIARSNALVIVSWPSPSTGFVLQQNTNLNLVNWTTPPETVTDNGTTRFITVSPASGNRFFRLFQP